MSVKYNAMKQVFADFHCGKRTKQEVTFAIGLWQLQEPPIKAPCIDRIDEFLAHLMVYTYE